MIRLLRYVMKIWYANENYAKYGVPGMNYFFALLMTAFFVIMTGIMIIFLLSAASTSFYKYGLHISNSISIKLFAILVPLSIFLFLRLGIKEESVKYNSFSKEQVTKAVNYLLAYMFIIAVIIVFLGLKFLRNYQHK